MFKWVHTQVLHLVQLLSDPSRVLRAVLVFWILAMAIAAIWTGPRLELSQVATETDAYLRRAFISVLPSPQAEFVQGVLFGGQDGLPKDLREAFRLTGVAHVTAASGFNVTLFSTTLLAPLFRRWFGRRRALPITIVLLALYVWLAGAGAPVLRAAIMTVVALLAYWLRRPADITNIFLLAIAALLTWNPLWIFDIGFQLSVVATASLVYWSHTFERAVTWLPTTFELRSLCASSLAASIATAPILFWHFGRVSLLAPLANLLILPAIPWLMVAGLLALAGAMVLPLSLAAITALPAWGLATVLLWVIDVLSVLSFASVSV